MDSYYIIGYGINFLMRFLQVVFLLFIVIDDIWRFGIDDIWRFGFVFLI